MVLNQGQFSRLYRLDMFTTTQAYKFVDHDIIILDEGIPEFSVESYMTRHNAQQDFEANVKYDPSGKVIRTISPEQISTYRNRPKTFEDFAKLYEESNFVQYAETTEILVNIANDQLLTWKNHLRNEGGFAPIRMKKPRRNETVAKPCILLPSTGLPIWKSSFNKMTSDLVWKHLRDWDPRAYDDPKELAKLLYVKRIGVVNRHRQKFLNVPVWKMDVMLKKWRTDRALERWGEMHGG